MDIRNAESLHVPEIEMLFGANFYMPQQFVDADAVGDCLVALDDGKVVGALKMCRPGDSDFEDWELRFCAVDSSYRRRGIAEQLIRKAISLTDGDVYASAWRTWDDPSKAHIRSVLLKVGFELESMGYKHWTARHFCKHGQCAYVKTNDKPSCECWEDIYVFHRP